MVTAAPPKTNQETWKDWLGPEEPEPDQLYSRDEIVKKANEIARPPGVKPVKASDLRLWEQLGLLPRGIRRSHQGAVRNLYPDWHASLARHVRQLQREGYSLDEIKPRIRNFARIRLWHDRNPVDDEIFSYRQNAEAPEDIPLWPVLIEELERLARWRSALTGVETERVEVRVIGKDNRGTIYNLPIAPHDENFD